MGAFFRRGACNGIDFFSRLGAPYDVSSLARFRYQASFGPLNQHLSLSGHSLVLIDAPKLVETSWLLAETGQDITHGLQKELSDVRFSMSIASTHGTSLRHQGSAVVAHLALTRTKGSTSYPLHAYPLGAANGRILWSFTREGCHQRWMGFGLPEHL